MKTDTLLRRANQMGAAAAERHCDRLRETNPPAGVRIDRVEGGISLSGKRLRLRMLTDPILRNFGR